MYIQRGTQRIEVIIRKDDGGSARGANEKSAEDANDSKHQSTKTGKPSSSNMSGSARSRFLRVNATHSFAVAKQLVDTGINYAIQGTAERSGDQSLQQLTERTFEIVRDTTNVASSIGMGALYGISGGPIGVLWGASLGAISSIGSIAFKYAGYEREFNYKTFKENNAIEYQRARASINLTTGRLR